MISIVKNEAVKKWMKCSNFMTFGQEYNSSRLRVGLKIPTGQMWPPAVVCFALTLTGPTEGHLREEHVKAHCSSELHVMLTVPAAVHSNKLLDGDYGRAQSIRTDCYAGLYSDYSILWFILLGLGRTNHYRPHSWCILCQSVHTATGCNSYNSIVTSVLRYDVSNMESITFTLQL